MEFRSKYLKYKIKYVELKNQIGGKLITPANRLFVKEYPSLKKAAIERNDKKFIEYGIPDEYMVEFNKLVDEEILFEKALKKKTREEKDKKNKEIKDRYEEIKGGRNEEYYSKMNNLKEMMTPRDNLLKWTIESYKKGTIRRIEDIDSRLKPAIDNYNILKRNEKTQEKIENLDGLIGLENYLDRPEIKEELDKLKGKEKETEEEKEIGRKGGEMIYDGKDIKIIKPITKEGSCYYGKGTRWCTAATSSENMFENYNKQGSLYIIQPKKPEREGKEKYQLHFKAKQYMDEIDEPIGLVELYKKYPEIDEIGKKDSAIYRGLLESDGANVEIVKKLIDRGADINEMYGLAGKNVEIIKYLLEKGNEKGKREGMDINIKDENGETPLYYAIGKSDINNVKYFVENSANINMKSRKNKTPLEEAFMKGNIDIIRYLVEKGAEMNMNKACDAIGSTQLHRAAKTGKMDIVKYLVEKGANINALDYQKNTPLHRAFEKENNVEIIKYLIEKGADITGKNSYGSPIDIAFQNENIDNIKYLVENKYFVEKGIDMNINKVDENGSTKLHNAVKNGKMDIVKFLVENGANINYMDRNKETPLSIAISYRKMDIIGYLIENGADINAKNNVGNTLLHNTIMNYDIDIMKYLVEKGADINAKNNAGKTPIEIGIESRDPEISAYMRELVKK